MALFKHAKTGIVVERPDHYAEHPVFKDYLILVDSAALEAPAETRKTSKPLTSAAEVEATSDIEVNIEPVKE